MRPVINNILTDKHIEGVNGLINTTSDNPLIKNGILKPSNKINLNSIIINLHRRFRDLALGKGLEFRYDITLDDTEAEILTDGRLLKTILSSLIRGAISSTADGYVSYGYLKREDYIEFYVADTGNGRQYCNNPADSEDYEQTKINFSVSEENLPFGIGDCKVMIEVLGGRRWIKSDPWDGSVYYFTIPYIKEYN